MGDIGYSFILVLLKPTVQNFFFQNQHLKTNISILYNPLFFSPEQGVPGDGSPERYELHPPGSWSVSDEER